MASACLHVWGGDLPARESTRTGTRAQALSDGLHRDSIRELEQLGLMPQDARCGKQRTRAAILMLSNECDSSPLTPASTHSSEFGKKTFYGRKKRMQGQQRQQH